MRHSVIKRTILIASLFTSHAAWAAAAPIVLELFTSQSCSSCPPADALLARIAQEDPSVLVLSYHVDYWDHLNWKDTYSSPANTQRQRLYAAAKKSTRVYTPQLIVNGTNSVTATSRSEVNRAIAAARRSALPVSVKLVSQGDSMVLDVSAVGVGSPVELWEVQYDDLAKTHIESGENAGRQLISAHNVTGLRRIASWNPASGAGRFTFPKVNGKAVAVLAQGAKVGPILGAATYKNF